MNKFKKLGLALVVSLSLAMVIPTTLLPVSPITAEAATVKISKGKATLEVDAQLKLKASGTKSTPKWITNKKSVATVNKDGVITAKAEGTATITATISNKKYTCVVTVVDSNKKTATKSTYKLGETWTVDGLWSLTFDSVTITEDRNQFSDKDPAQVVVLNYTYENIGYKSSFMDLYISSVSMKVVDENKEIADTYPAGTTVYPQEIPVGTKCVGAQEAFGLNNESSKITVYVELYDAKYNKHTATFDLKVN